MSYSPPAIEPGESRDDYRKRLNAWLEIRDIDPTHYTPNVRLEDPNKRRLITTILGYAGFALGAALVFDMTSEWVNWYEWTTPAAAVLLWAGSYFGVAITLPNTPKA